jgi:hypothetical protein
MRPVRMHGAASHAMLKILDKRSPKILLASLVDFGTGIPKYRSAENLVDSL